MDGRNDRGKAGPPSRHRGFTICRACSACHVRARLARAQLPADLASLFLARAQPLLPLPPASQSRLPCTLQSLRRRHRRQFCSPQPWQLRARASSIRRRRHLTPRAGQRHQPLTARPNLPFPTLASSASNQVAPLFFSECSGSTTSEAGPTGGPACPAMPPTPHPLGPWIEQLWADSSTSWLPAPTPRVVS